MEYINDEHQKQKAKDSLTNADHFIVIAVVDGEKPEIHSTIAGNLDVLALAASKVFGIDKFKNHNNL